MPTYNRASLIAESIEAIINQNYQHWECIIVDDGSIDTTADIVKLFADKDQRITYLERPQHKAKGANVCRNYGLSLCKGEFVLWVDSDDIIHPNCLEVCIEIITGNAVDFCRFNKTVFFGNTHDYVFSTPNVNNIITLNKNNILDLLNHRIPFNTCTVLWKRSALKDSGFSEAILYADEWEYYARLLSTDIKGVSIDTVLYYVRKHGDSTTAEFWDNNITRRTSKIKACELVIQNLKNKNLLNYQLAVYFVSLALFLNEKEVYQLIVSNSGHLSIAEQLKLKLRYHFNIIICPLYQLKKKLK